MPTETVGQNVAPGFYYKEYTVDYGLPINTITDVYTTPDGFVWITTSQGLIRFDLLVNADHMPFQLYNRYNTPAFPTNRLLDIKKAGQQEFFILTAGVQGERKLVHSNGREFKYLDIEQERLFTAHSISLDDMGQPWIVLDGKIYKYEGGRLVPKFTNTDLSDYGKQWELDIISKEGLILRARTNKLLIISDDRSKVIGANLGLPNDQIRSFHYDDSNHALWLGTKDAVYKVKNDEIVQRFEDLNFDPELLQEFYTFPGDTNRILFRAGAQYFIIYNDRVTEVTESGTGQSLGDMNIQVIPGDEGSSWMVMGDRIFYDNELVFITDERINKWSISEDQSIWFVTTGRLNHLKSALFQSYSTESHGIDNVYPMFQDHTGAIWISSLFEGVQIIKNNEVLNFDQGTNFRTKRIQAFAEDSSQNIWLAGNRGLFKWQRGQPFQDIQSINELDFGSLFGLKVDQLDRIWTGGNKGVFVYEQNRWIEIHVENGIKELSVRMIFEDHEGKIWFGTNGYGLLYYDEEEGVLRTAPFNDQLSGRLISSLYQDDEQALWVGVSGLGLNRVTFDHVSSEYTVKEIGQTSGLRGFNIHSILEDDSGRLWMSSNEGIFWVKRSMLNEYLDGKIPRIYSVAYSEKDGLPGLEANGGMQSSALKASDGKLWFSMLKGIGVIDSDLLQDQQGELDVYVYSVHSSDSTYNVALQQENKDQQSKLKLSSRERDLEFRFGAYNPALNPSQLKFRYRLTGYEENWHETIANYKAFYTGVKGGDYNFELQTAEIGKDWGEAKRVVPVTIEKYFTETIWFKLIMATGFFSLISFGVQRRLRKAKRREEDLVRQVDAQTAELRKQAEQLQELDEAKSKFFSNVTHELKTPLTLILGSLNDLRKNEVIAKEDKSSGKIDLAFRNSNRLLRLVNQILDISKLESNAVEMKIQKANLVEVLEQIVMAFSGLAERKKISISFDHSNNHIPLFADVDMLDKIFINLISNAFKFTPKKGEISITINELDKEVEVSISDTGVGVAPEDLPYLFDRFYQTGESNNINKAGVGIGLSLVKELVDLHKGYVTVESKVNSGTEFKIRFKKGREHFAEEDFLNGAEEIDQRRVIEYSNSEPPLNGYDTVENKEKSLDEKTVLVVEDNTDIRKYLTHHLSAVYNVLEADNGEAGLRLANEELPDIIISDVMMPKMNGYEFCEALKSNFETDFIPVILLTAKTEQKDKLEGLYLGADDYIIKPFDIEEVMARISNFINTRKKLIARFELKPHSLSPEAVEIQSEDEAFLEDVKQKIEEHHEDENFGVGDLASALAINRGTLHNKLKNLVGKSPSEVIKEYRLQRAHQLLSQNAGNISEVAYSVGFKSISHFSRVFKVHYRVTPSQFLSRVRSN